MPKHFERYISNHNPEDLYSIVIDVEKYPEFLPWVAGARILEVNEKENWFTAEIMVKFAAFSHSYVSKVISTKPKTSKDNWQIDVELVKGPFKHLTTNWIVIPKPKIGGSEIMFELDFRFKSLMLEKLIGGLFEKASRKMATSFQKRADKIYGKK